MHISDQTKVSTIVFTSASNQGQVLKRHWQPLQGACSADIAAARVATSLDVLSYPVVADELLRLTAFLHTMAGKAGHIGMPCTFTFTASLDYFRLPWRLPRYQYRF